ncbi:SDR family oxidoreductase [Bradyrhizobium sp. CCGB20]|uniref:SDR family oxidoreductase n=1 Tax=Bradyrhizobium sp. CCGB20 TaxID=2949633 RepID=UPI0020B4325C|nr:SDR family oxidoreductase [Bradyrhizobium sp. CCGB20]MCP3402824.1 SDR family oxidoreductase [Bradyrhizobium sp. CCGB20]
MFVTGSISDPRRGILALDRQFDINLRSVANVVRTAVPLMSDGGSIASISTAGAMHHTVFAGVADYVATKAAVAAYTRSWARDLGPRGIRANVIKPGPIDTGMAPTEAWVTCSRPASLSNAMARPKR